MDICLGTVQFGIQYGIVGNNKPSYDKGIEMLSYAYQNGIRDFDTAIGYGDAQKLLGQIVEDLSLANSVNIVSKAKSSTPDALEGNLDTTLETLNIKQLYGYLIHAAEDMYNVAIKDRLVVCKQKMKTENIGVSVYLPSDAVYAAQQDWIDIIQIPYNVFDQRLHRTSFFSLAKNNGKKIFARSSLLQGLLSMSEEDCREKLPRAANYLSRFIRLTRESGYSQIEAAIQFVKANDLIDSLVFGVDNIDQLQEFINTFHNCKIDPKLIQTLRSEFAFIEDERIVMPNSWDQLKVGDFNG